MVLGRSLPSSAQALPTVSQLREAVQSVCSLSEQQPTSDLVLSAVLAKTDFHSQRFYDVAVSLISL